MSWNDSNVARLKELWDQGLPTAQIGKLLGFTKNAVVGKAHRIGLERRPSPIRRTAVKPDRKKARSPVMPKLNFESTKEPEIVSTEPAVFQPVVKNLFTAAPKRGCEWPEGHPDEPEFHFCTLPPSPTCPFANLLEKFVLLVTFAEQLGILKTDRYILVAYTP